ncbi:snRNA-activating protein of 50kDa MW C terminal-domain-containing protein [Gorgonomyces haynaldii]|nr:snRNA-activating protein of 50kDa MW C terminal-domain-containing protein [Gorgonomyces haynaldii]
MYKDSEPVHEDKSEFDTTHVDGCLQIRIGFPAVFGLAIAKRHSRVQCLSKSAIHQLVDATDCPSDKISMDPQPVVPLPLLFIGDCVYIDTRNAHAVSMQATTLFLSNLVGNHSRTASMDTHFTDLNLKLNHYYLYMHQGNCRHYIVFEKLFLNTTTLDYPRTLVENPVFFPPQCAVCGLDTARFVSFGDLKLDKDPCLWCQGCHDKFHPNETVAIDINF